MTNAIQCVQKAVHTHPLDILHLGPRQDIPHMDLRQDTPHADLRRHMVRPEAAVAPAADVSKQAPFLIERKALFLRYTDSSRFRFHQDLLSCEDRTV